MRDTGKNDCGTRREDNATWPTETYGVKRKRFDERTLACRRRGRTLISAEYQMAVTTRPCGRSNIVVVKDGFMILFVFLCRYGV